MRSISRSLATAGLALAVAASAFAYGTDGSLNDIHSALSEAVAAGDPSAVKMNNFVEQESPSLSKDFVTFSKVVKEAEKGGYQVLSEEFLQQEFSDLLVQSAEYGVSAFQHLVNAANNNPLKAAKLLRSQAKYFAKEAKELAKFNKVWGELADPSKVDMAKAAIAWSHAQKLYEIIEKAASKYDPPV